MKAVGKYIIIQSQEEHTVKTKGGLILGENQREDIRYREGDKIYFDKHAGFKVEIDNTLYTVIKEFDVVIVL
jgi:co-chaperonin GroES (HSP10)